MMTTDFTKVDLAAVGLERPHRTVERRQRPAATARADIRHDDQEVAVEPLADLGRLLVAHRRVQRAPVNGVGRRRPLREQRVVVGQVPVDAPSGQLIEVGVAFSAVN